MKWVVTKSKFQAFLVPNYRAFRIPVKYVTDFDEYFDTLFSLSFKY